MKVNTNWVLRNLPFLRGLVEEANLKARSSIRLQVQATPGLSGLFESRAALSKSVRFCHTGKLSGPNWPQLNSQLDPAAKMVCTEADTPLAFKVQQHGYAAVLEQHLSNGYCELTLTVRPEDLNLNSVTPEFKNFLIIVARDDA